MTPSQRILVVEDACDTQLLLRSVLARYDVVCVGTTTDAYACLTNEKFDLIILDVELPGESGFQFCHRLRGHQKHKDIPIIFLTGRRLAADKVTAFSLGAEDYIVKPIDVIEFQARIDAKMRKLNNASLSKDVYTYGPFKVYLAPQKITLSLKGQESDLDLRGFEFKLFYFLLRNEGKVLTREQVLTEVWGQNLNVTFRTVDTHIYTLRRKIGEFADWIKTIPRSGYMFAQGRGAEVELSHFNSRALDGLKIPGPEGMDLVATLTEAMFATAPERLQKISSFVSEEKYTEAALEAHSLKSSVRTMGADILGELCKRMEFELNNGMEKAKALVLCQELSVEYERFAFELAAFTGIAITSRAS